MTSHRDRSLLLVLTGGFVVWLVLSGTVLNFVRPSMRPYVLVAGVIAILLGLAPEGASDEHGHGHRVGVGWLLVLPVLVGLVVPPAPLGSNAVRSRLVAAGSSSSDYPPVRSAVRGAVPMTMVEFYTRAVRDPHQSLRDVRVRLVGFVSAPADPGGGYRISRFVIFCCAADAEAVEVAVSGDPVARKRDQWVEVEGTWRPGPASDDVAPRLDVTAVRAVKRPAEPYEYTTVWSG